MAVERAAKDITFWFSRYGLSLKVGLLAGLCVFIAAGTLLGLVIWQSGRYNQLANEDVDALIKADLDHITQVVYNLVRTEDEAAKMRMTSDLEIARYVFAEHGGIFSLDTEKTWQIRNHFTGEVQSLRLPLLSVTSSAKKEERTEITKTPLLDRIALLTGKQVALFQRMNEQGEMLCVDISGEPGNELMPVGTYLPATRLDGSITPSLVSILQGTPYHDRIEHGQRSFLTIYGALQDSSGRVFGMLALSMDQKVVESRVRRAVLETRIGKTGYVYVLAGTGWNRGHYIISLDGRRDGEDVWAVRDHAGHYVIREIIGRAIQLSPGEITNIRYLWQNEDDVRPRWKIAHLAYYAPWDWVIGSSAYEDELQAYRTVLSDGQVSMVKVMAVVMVLITLLVICLCIVAAYFITRPIRQVTDMALEITEGNLNHSIAVTSHDEIGVLARTFNEMTVKLRETLEGLSESRQKYRSLYQNALEGIFRSSMDGRLLRVNPAMATILGYQSESELMTAICDVRTQLYANPEDRDRLLSVLRSQGMVSGYEVQMIRKNKGKAWMSVSGRVVSDHEGELSHIEGFIVDISDRKAAEERIAESRNYLHEIINAVADPLFVKDIDHRWVLVNDAFCEFLGKERQELQGKTDYDFSARKEADESWEKDSHVLATGAENINEESFTDRQGSVRIIVTKKSRYVDKKGNKYIVGIIRDITYLRKAEQEKRQLEVRLNHAGKMEAIGTLAGGIAHDFNNILTAIIGYSELAMAERERQDNVRDHIRQVIKAGKRAKELVRQILTFSRMTETEYIPLSVSSVLKESLKMLRSLIPANIEIREDLCVEGLIYSDPTQLHQIIMNLCTNATHAMESTGGVLTVSLQEQMLDVRTADKLDLPLGVYVHLRVSDTGTGIENEHLERIFEPYFTTKELGRGTGLGLSVIHGIVKNHGGAIHCSSRLGTGTSFDIYFPKLQNEVVSGDSSHEQALPEGREHILFVDDEPALADLAEKVLTRLQYKVTLSTSSTEALSLFRNKPGAFDLVITDTTMPSLTGDRLAQELLKIRPDIPVILCTGYSETMTELRAKEIGVREFLLKPLDQATLAGTVRRVLDNG